MKVKIENFGGKKRDTGTQLLTDTHLKESKGRTQVHTAYHHTIPNILPYQTIAIIPYTTVPYQITECMYVDYTTI